MIKRRIRNLVITTLIMLVGLLHLTTLLQVKTTGLSDTTIKHIIYADSVGKEDVYVTIELKDLEEDIEQNEVVALVALQGVGEKILEEENRKIEEQKLKEKQERELQERLLAESKSKLTFNPYEKSNLTINQYNNMLKGTGLEGAGVSFYNMEQNYGVNGMFAVSVALHESGLGRHKANRNNFFGMKSSNGWMSFDSVDANIQYFGRLMNKSIYKGKDITNIGKVYCPDTYKDWASKVQWFMTNYYSKR